MAVRGSGTGQKTIAEPGAGSDRGQSVRPLLAAPVAQATSARLTLTNSRHPDRFADVAPRWIYVLKTIGAEK
jgi:hypothetical protein